MQTTLGFRLNSRVTAPGIGIANPIPIPPMPSGLQQLHLIRRGAGISRWDRVSYNSKGFVPSEGIEFTDTSAVSPLRFDRIDMEMPITYDTGFTFGIVHTINDDPGENFTVATSRDYSNSQERGFEIELRYLNDRREYRFNVGTQQGWRQFGSNRDDPVEGNRIGFLAVSDQGDLSWHMPHSNRFATGTLEGSGTNPAPDAGIRLLSQVFIDPENLPNPSQGYSVSAVMMWNRALSQAESQAAYDGLKPWLAQYDLDIH